MPTTYERAAGGSIKHRRTHISYADLIAAATSETENIGGALPTGAVVLACWLDLETDFADTETNITSVTVQVGTSGDPNAFFTALEVLSGSPANGRYEQKGVWISADAAQLIATFTATGANFGDGADSDLDAGKLVVHVLYIVVPD